MLEVYKRVFGMIPASLWSLKVSSSISHFWVLYLSLSSLYLSFEFSIFRFEFSLSLFFEFSRSLSPSPLSLFWVLYLSFEFSLLSFELLHRSLARSLSNTPKSRDEKCSFMYESSILLLSICLLSLFLSLYAECSLCEIEIIPSMWR